ncbi:MAG TPA: hypothetical protein VJ785_06780 [Anaerolineales bacterium]|nr:hypothetical protein [Anaerolineales bacterium]
MTSRNLFLIAIAILLLIAAVFIYHERVQEPLQTFPAVVDRDCAPWDGSAFTVSIADETGLVIYVSIWQSPDLKFPSTFAFPDETGQTGIAYILPELDPLEQLSGRVTFQRVEQGTPVEGEFELSTETGQRFSGKFLAEWGNEIVYCG